MATLRGCPERWCSRGDAWLLVGSPAAGGGGAGRMDQAQPAMTLHATAHALACEAALDIDRGARREVADVGEMDAAEDDPVTVDPLAERISLGEQDEA